ncbi:hypothetical protein ACLMJK_007971 [Lecanora helva]
MFLRRHETCLQRCLKTSRDHIWISEDALDNAIQRFSHTRVSRRHVGLAPGPLEARKRANKRRMMNLAQAESGSELNPAVLHGLKRPPQTGWHWQSPSPTHPRTSKGTPILPTWLTEPLPDLPIDSNPTVPQEEPQPASEEDKRVLSDVVIQAEVKPLQADASFLEGLERCNDLAGLRAWSASFGVELRSYARLAFRQICKGTQDFEVLFEAIGDRALSTPGNLQFLFEKRTSHPLSLDDSLKLGGWLEQSLFLGQMSEAQISLITDFVLRVSTVTEDEQIKCNLIGGVLRGLKSSTVFNLKKLKYTKVDVLLKATTLGPFTTLSEKLGVQIVEALEPPTKRRLVRSISLLVQRSICAEASGNLQNHGNAVPRSCLILQDLHQGTSSTAIIETSKALLDQVTCSSKPNSPLLKVLDRWWRWIMSFDAFKTVNEGSERRKLEPLLIESSMVIEASYLRHIDDLETARFVLRRKILIHLDPEDQSRAVAQFELIQQQEPHASPYVGMLRAAHEVCTISERTMLRIFRLLMSLRKSRGIANMIVDLRKVNILISESIVLKILRSGLRWRYNRLDRIFAVFRELPLERCPVLAERMIRDTNYRPSEALKRYVQRHPGASLPGCRERLTTIQARSKLLQRMAIAYSTTTHLIPSRAFYYVYKCYIYHVRERLCYSGKRNLTIALVRSAIVRPLECGKRVSTQRIRWLLQLIRKHEGDGVAEQVDRIIYEWRGKVIEKRRADYYRKRARYGAKEEPMSFRFGYGWVKGLGYANRVLRPLEKSRKD